MTIDRRALSAGPKPDAQNAALGAFVRAMPSGFSIGRDKGAPTYFLDWSRPNGLVHGVCGRRSPEEAVTDFLEVYRGYLEFLPEADAKALEPALQELGAALLAVEAMGPGETPHP